MLSIDTQKMLKKSGWNKNRRIDISSYEKDLLAEGYPINDKIRNFLISFGGLEVHHPHHRVQNEEDEFHLNPSVAIQTIYPERVEEYNHRTNNHLVVIGEASKGYLILMMGLDGKVYAGYDDFLLLLGFSGEDALETLCEGKSAPEIP